MVVIVKASERLNSQLARAIALIHDAFDALRDRCFHVVARKDRPLGNNQCLLDHGMQIVGGRTRLAQPLARAKQHAP